MEGQVLGHYRLIERLGAGGMGVVWLAEDTILGRRVALKLILPRFASDASAVERLRREARAAAGLSHPNIVTVHAVEELPDGVFLVMEHVRGEALGDIIPTGGLPLSRLLELAVPLADALAAAHDAGVVHRDVKPGNVMVTSGGHLKVLDFGIARLRPASGTEHTEVAGTPAPQPLTQDGTVLGTLPYMSPEQLHGREVDQRSDVFSLGAVLYQMASGRPPFASESPAGLLTAILRDEPPPRATDGDPARATLMGIVGRCLAKDPAARFASAREVRDELAALHDEVRWLTAPRETARPRTATVVARRPARWRLAAALAVVVALAVAGSWWLLRALRPAAATATAAPAAAAPAAARKVIAVLPFTNIGPREQEYFAEGLTDEIISRLAGVEGLGVISRTSASRFGSSGKTTQEIGRALGAQFLLAGTVQWAAGGGRVRVAPQLLRVADDTYLWAASINRGAGEIFALQSEIASQVARALDVELTTVGAEAAERPPTQSLAAYRAYLAGMEAFRSSPEDVPHLRTSQQMLQRAVAKDPRFTVAWAELSHLLSYLYFNPSFAPQVPRAQLLRDAEVALQRAESMSKGEPSVALARAYHRYYGFYDYAGALAALAPVRAARPDDPEVLRLDAYVRRRQGKIEEAAEEMARLLELDPQNASLRSDYAETIAARRRFAPADRILADAIALFPAEASLYVERADLLVRWRGDLDGAAALLAAAPAATDVALARARLLRYRRDWPSLLALLGGLSLDSSSERTARTCWPGLPETLAGDAAAARRDLEACVALLAGRDDSGSLARRAEALALLGRAEEAQATAERAVAAAAADHFTGPATRQSLASVAAWTGRPDDALAVLRELLRTDYQRPLTPAMLRLEPVWEPLRSNAEFQRLAAASK